MSTRDRGAGQSDAGARSAEKAKLRICERRGGPGLPFHFLVNSEIGVTVPGGSCVPVEMRGERAVVFEDRWPVISPAINWTVMRIDVSPLGRLRRVSTLERTVKVKLLRGRTVEVVYTHGVVVA